MGHTTFCCISDSVEKACHFPKNLRTLVGSYLIFHVFLGHKYFSQSIGRLLCTSAVVPRKSSSLLLQRRCDLRAWKLDFKISSPKGFLKWHQFCKIIQPMGSPLYLQYCPLHCKQVRAPTPSWI